MEYNELADIKWIKRILKIKLFCNQNLKTLLRRYFYGIQRV
ncbi:MAG: hypothetical protein ACPL28_07170 [bacterium]